MKRGLKKMLFMIKGTKKRPTKKCAMKHTPLNKMNHNVTKNKNTKNL